MCLSPKILLHILVSIFPLPHSHTHFCPCYSSNAISNKNTISQWNWIKTVHVVLFLRCFYHLNQTIVTLLYHPVPPGLRPSPSFKNHSDTHAWLGQRGNGHESCEINVNELQFSPKCLKSEGQCPYELWDSTLCVCVCVCQDVAHAHTRVHILT